MKKQLLLLAGMLCFVVTAWAAPTAKAIYCAANTTLYFTYDEVMYNTTTAYDNLDGNTPTKVYDNIPLTGYQWNNPGGGAVNNDEIYDPSEVETPWVKDYMKEITTVKFLETFKNWKPTRLNGYFFYLSNLKTIIGGENVNTSELKMLYNTFFNCRSLENLDFLASWDMPKLASLDQTFGYCISLTNLDPLSNEGWDVSKVENMQNLFIHCSSLTDISGITNWNTSKVKNFNSIFSSCRALEDISPLKNWDVSSAIILSHAFDYCSNLTDISPLSDWAVGNVEEIGYMFGRTNVEKAEALSKWNTSNVKVMGDLFLNCKNLKSIEGLENWDTSNLMHMQQMFDGCSSLLSLEPIYNWNTSKVYNMYRIFNSCESLTKTIDLSKWDLSSLGEGRVKTSYRYEDTELGVGSNSWSGNYQIREAFSSCTGITGVFFGKGNVGNKEAINRTNTFSNCPKLRFIDLSGCTDTNGNVVSASRTTNGDMFYTVPRTCVIYLPSGNGQPTKDDLENVVYTASDETLQCDKYYSEDKVDIELPHRFHADLATYERTFNSTYGGVILPYPVKINDNDEDEFQPFLLQREFKDHMFFKGIAEVPANTPFCFKRKQASTDMTFRMEDLWVESTYDISGETSDNIEEGFAWKTQGFYVNNVIEPENGKFAIPTMDDYIGKIDDNVQTSTAEYDYDHVYYLSKNRFYRCDDAALTIAPHRILFYGLWEAYSGTDPEKTGSFDFEELGDDVVDAIQAAETDMDEAKAAAIYDANGNRLSKTQHGLNILRMSDGSVKKVIKK